jgi:hypothetical protein
LILDVATIDKVVEEAVVMEEIGAKKVSQIIREEDLLRTAKTSGQGTGLRLEEEAVVVEVAVEAVVEEDVEDTMSILMALHRSHLLSQRIVGCLSRLLMLRLLLRNW